MAFCKSITKVESTGGIDIMLCVVDDVESYWFYDYSKALEFIGKEVIVSYREDFYKGSKVTAINTIAIPNVINVLDKHTALKLYSDAEDNAANISFNELEMGHYRDGCIFYCCSQQVRSSASATWLEAVIRDKMFRTAKLRIFDPEDSTVYEGHYCMATLQKTQYGLQTDLMTPTSTEVPPNPEIALAKEYINRFFSEDAEAMDFITNNNLIAAMEKEFDYEYGYSLVRLAIELCLCESFYNVSKDIDVKTLTHAILVSHGYASTPNLPISKETSSIMTAVRSKWSNLKLMLSIVDPGQLEKEPFERDLFKRVKSMSDSIIVSRKTYRE